MSAMKAAGKTKPSPTAPATMLSLTIARTTYRVMPIMTDPSSGVARAYRLFKRADDQLYDVAEHDDGTVACTCADWIMRRASSGETCKHGTALVALGLLSRPTSGTSDNNSAAAESPSTAGCDLTEIVPCSARSHHAPDPAVGNPEPAQFSESMPQARRFRSGSQSLADLGDVEASAADFSLEKLPPLRGHRTDGGPSSLLRWVVAQGETFRAMRTDAADLIAEAVERLASDLRSTRARTVADHRDRIATFLD